MKKITLLFLFISILNFGEIKAQVDHYYAINGLNTSGNGRAPQGSRNVTRSVWLITAAEMTAAGFINGDVITGLGFTYQVAQNTTTTGTFVAYLQNTTDATNTKSTTWATAIGGMTTVSDGSITLPNTPGEFNYNFTGGSPFTYTGGALYIAYDYQNLANPVATSPNFAYCNTALTNGIKTGMSAVGVLTPPTTIVQSSFRPVTRLGINVACARPYNLFSNVSTNTTNSALISYIPVGGSNVEIQYGDYNFTLGTGETITGVNTSPYSIPNLTPNTVYDVYMRTNCGAGFSTWNGPYSLNTVFEAVTPPYNTSFEQENLNFVGWSTPNFIPVAGDWSTSNFGPGTLVQDGNSSVVSITPATPATTPANNWMFSRGVNLTAGSDVSISFFISNFVGTGSTNTGNYELTIGNAQTVVAQTTVVGTESGISDPLFVEKTYNYTTPSTGVYYFGIRNFSPLNTTGTHALLVDNFTVTETLSSDEFISTKFNVYPNPANDIVTISSADYTINSIEMTDINGRVVKNNNLNNVNEVQISISELAQGVYFLKIISENGIATKKLVVE